MVQHHIGHRSKVWEAAQETLQDILWFSDKGLSFKLFSKPEIIRNILEIYF